MVLFTARGKVTGSSLIYAGTCSQRRTGLAHPGGTAQKDDTAKEEARERFNQLGSALCHSRYDMTSTPADLIGATELNFRILPCRSTALG